MSANWCGFLPQIESVIAEEEKPPEKANEAGEECAQKGRPKFRHAIVWWHSKNLPLVCFALVRFVACCSRE